ncbi:MAG: hemerythrin domain-containing protein [Acidimicrobiia bacterium]|nr:hemerythrin domain-containing protein [Acidimicrobiia bacterium]
MNSITLLTQDHRNVEALFKRFEAAEDERQKRDIADKVIEQLSIHAELEEQLFYPALKAKLDDGGDVIEGIEEHHLAKVSLWELERLPVSAPNFDAKFKIMAELIRHHVEEEEGEGGIFAQARKAMKANELAALGERMEKAKATVPSRPHPLAPPVPPFNSILGLPVAVLDKVVNAGKGVVQGALRRVS